MSRRSSSQVGDEKTDDARSEYPSPPEILHNPAERGRELGEENAYGGHSVGTGGHGNKSGCSSRQRVGGEHYKDISQFTQEQQHPGMNPDDAERGRELGEENAYGGHSVGTGGHGKESGCSSRQRVGGEHYTDISQFTQEQKHPGMNPDYAERGRQLGEENACGGHSVGTGGHGNKSGYSKLTSTYQGFFEFQCDYDFRQLTVCWW
ncbi:unnamed protein product [Rotaria sp. Silwood2]|nr:unnamed protein product [Rotaria sp. Silwood2]